MGRANSGLGIGLIYTVVCNIVSSCVIFSLDGVFVQQLDALKTIMLKGLDSIYRQCLAGVVRGKKLKAFDKYIPARKTKVHSGLLNDIMSYR